MKILANSAFLWALSSTAAMAAGFSPLTLSGFNFDGIVERTAAPPYSSAATALDLSSRALFELGLPSATAGGLPQGGQLTFTANSNNYTFQLASYNGNNLLRINPTGTLTLASPASYSQIAVLGFSTENSSPGAIEMVGDATLHFTDTSTSVYSHSVDLSDWFAAAPPNTNVATAVSGGLVNVTSGTAAGAFSTTAGGPKFYVSLITLTGADAAKTLSSVSFGNFPFGGNSFQFVMAIDGPSPVIPPPPPPATVPALSPMMMAVLGVLLLGTAALAMRPSRA